MDLPEIAKHRLVSQQIERQRFVLPKDVVSWMGAMQAQDFQMSKWAVGIRLPSTNASEIQAALDHGDVVRTHVLRPTWHFVSAEDVHWMLELSAPRIKSSMKSRWKELELSEAEILKCYKVLENALANGTHLTRNELKPLFASAHIKTDGNNRFSHILMSAELEKIICSGVAKGKGQTYALLDERVKKKRDLSRDEALATLAFRYFRSHGPATLPDFAWWSGLSMTEARRGLEMAKPRLTGEKNSAETYWISSDFPGNDQEAMAYLIPAYDEMIISYKDRSALLSAAHQKKAISSNGMFYPGILINGQVIGMWKRTVGPKAVKIKFDFFSKPTRRQSKLLDLAIKRFEDFSQLPVKVGQ